MSLVAVRRADSRHVRQAPSADNEMAMRAVSHWIDAEDGWKVLLSCGHALKVKRTARHQHPPGKGKLIKCWTCKHAVNERTG